MEYVISKLSELTGKKICSCQIDPVLKKYEIFREYQPENKKEDFKNQSNEFQISFIACILGLKLKNKTKQKTKKAKVQKETVDTGCSHFSL